MNSVINVPLMSNWYNWVIVALVVMFAHLAISTLISVSKPSESAL